MAFRAAVLQLTSTSDADASLVSERLTEESLVVACAPEHRLAGRRVRVRLTDARAASRERRVASGGRAALAPRSLP